MDLSASVTTLKGIGAARASAFQKAGVSTLRHLLFYYPRGYIDKSVVKNIAETAVGESCTVVASVRTAPSIHRLRGGLTAVKFSVGDGTGNCQITFFNQPFRKNQFRVGETYRFYGKFDGNLISRSLTNPATEAADVEGGVEKSPITPVYPLVSGLTQSAVASAVRQVLGGTNQISETLPQEILQKYRFDSLPETVYHLHAPMSMADVNSARRRMMFEEMLTLQLGMLMLKGTREKKTECVCYQTDLSKFYSCLPFELTNAQKRCINEGIADMKSGAPMNRLVQGDVGSGKTMVATALCVVAMQCGFQSMFLAPTEILVRQHAQSLSKLLAPLGYRVGLLIGGMKAAEKREVLSQIATGEIQLCVCTHAVLEQNVLFKNLGLVVCDEQHRFGVEQRSRAAQKGKAPHILVMSATPIPRTLALMIYGDLDLSVVDELPPGRKPTATHLVDESKRSQVDRFIEERLAKGKQGYIICPMVEESEAMEGLKDVQNFAKELSEKFPTAHVGLIHGRLSAVEKEKEMRSFREGDTQILVSTTVIEVGVDVPNANFIVIENAERFGLSQLHQLRGRVGRGTEKAYCILVSEKNQSDRLRAMEEITDGFVLAQRDLELRGPGDFLGNRQSGLPALNMASLAVDSRIFHAAGEEAKTLFEKDSTLSRYPALKEEINKLFSPESGICFN